MKIEADHVFPVLPQELWDMLHDPRRLTNCIPGCEELAETDADTYTATLKIGVASVKGTYLGRVEIRQKNPYSDYQLLVEGSGSPGFVRGQATISLAPHESQTRLSVSGDAQVGGLIASVGQRFLTGIARQMIGVFFRNIEKELSPTSIAD
jgi:uncharacterized protein